MGNGVWGLMNLAYDADEALKNKIVEAVGIQNILSLLNDTNVDVTVKAAGILRNLTERQSDIDNLMKAYGTQIMTFVKHFITDDNLSDKLKEQILCLTSNIASGSYSGDVLMGEDEVVSKIIEYTSKNDEKLQMAAVFCISNLIRNTSEQGADRRDKLREKGAEKSLQNLLTTTNTSLFDRVKVTL